MTDKELENAEMPKLDALPKKPFDGDFPIRNYETLAAAVVEVAVEDYKVARKFIRKERKAKLKKIYTEYVTSKNRAKAAKKAAKSMKRLIQQIINAERDISECESFFLSDRFAIFMPHTDGMAFLRALRELTK